jgi:hypothetical protein
MWACGLFFILFDKTLANPNYIPVYMKVNYLLAISKYICVFVILPSKEKNYFMFGCT